MKRNLSFILNNMPIYNDCCLVEDDIPIFFTCIDDNNSYYLALCVDMDLPKYNVVAITQVQLHNMLNGILSMREIFIMQNEYWEVTPIDDKIENDIVVIKQMCDINCDELPNEGVYFELFNKDLQEYARKISLKLINKEFSCTLIAEKEPIIIESQYHTSTINVNSSHFNWLIEYYTEINKSLKFQTLDSFLTVAGFDYSNSQTETITNKMNTEISNKKEIVPIVKSDCIFNTEDILQNKASISNTNPMNLSIAA